MDETWRMTGMGLSVPHSLALKCVVVCQALRPSSVQQTCSLRSVQNIGLPVVATATSFGLMLPAVTRCWISFGATEQCLASLSLKCWTRHEVTKPKAPVHCRLSILGGPFEYLHLGFEKPEKGGPGPHWPVAAKESVGTRIGFCVCVCVCVCVCARVCVCVSRSDLLQRLL